MGGSIDIRSEGLGKGTVARVTLPLATPEHTAVSVPPPSVQPVALLVGADLPVRQQLADTLVARGYVVRQRATVDGVRAMARTERFDVVLLDVTGEPGRSKLASWLDLLVELKTEVQSSSAEVIVLANGGLDAPSRVQLDVLASSTIIDTTTNPEALVNALDAATAHDRHGLMRVLVVEDDPLVFRFVSTDSPVGEVCPLARKGRR